MTLTSLSAWDDIPDTLYLFTSLTSGSSHIHTATNRMCGILSAHDVKCVALVDIAVNSCAKRLLTLRRQKYLASLPRDGNSDECSSPTQAALSRSSGNLESSLTSTTNVDGNSSPIPTSVSTLDDATGKTVKSSSRQNVSWDIHSLPVLVKAGQIIANLAILEKWNELAIVNQSIGMLADHAQPPPEDIEDDVKTSSMHTQNESHLPAKGSVAKLAQRLQTTNLTDDVRHVSEVNGNGTVSGVIGNFNDKSKAYGDSSTPTISATGPRRNMSSSNSSVAATIRRMEARLQEERATTNKYVITSRNDGGIPVSTTGRVTDVFKTKPITLTNKTKPISSDSTPSGTGKTESSDKPDGSNGKSTPPPAIRAAEFGTYDFGCAGTGFAGVPMTEEEIEAKAERAFQATSEALRATRAKKPSSTTTPRDGPRTTEPDDALAPAILGGNVKDNSLGSERSSIIDSSYSEKRNSGCASSIDTATTLTPSLNGEDGKCELKSGFDTFSQGQLTKQSDQEWKVGDNESKDKRRDSPMDSQCGSTLGNDSTLAYRITTCNDLNPPGKIPINAMSNGMNANRQVNDYDVGPGSVPSMTTCSNMDSGHIGYCNSYDNTNTNLSKSEMVRIVMGSPKSIAGINVPFEAPCGDIISDGRSTTPTMPPEPPVESSMCKATIGPGDLMMLSQGLSACDKESYSSSCLDHPNQVIHENNNLQVSPNHGRTNSTELPSSPIHTTDPGYDVIVQSRPNDFDYQDQIKSQVNQPLTNINANNDKTQGQVDSRYNMMIEQMLQEECGSHVRSATPPADDTSSHGLPHV